MVMKQLTQSGNSKAILIDKALLIAAGLGDNALFSVTVNPNGGLTIQSVESSHADLKKAAFRKVMKANRNLVKRLTDR